jgi:hypothetical protein
MFRSNLVTALIHLKNNDFSAYIKVLAELGLNFADELQINTADLGDISTGALKQRLNSIQEIDLNLPAEEIPVNLPAEEIPETITEEDLQHARLAAELFYSSWSTRKRRPAAAASATDAVVGDIEPLSVVDEVVDERAYQFKSTLNKSSRQAIFLGMLAVQSFLDQYQAPRDISLATHLHVLELESENKKLEIQARRELDDKIFDAIQNYETPRQEVVGNVGRAMAFITSFAFGAVETGTAIFLIGMMFHPVGWALYGLLGLAVLLGGLATYVNYVMFKTAVPGVLNKIVGKDKLFQGFLEYKDENGQTAKLSTRQTIAMGVFGCLFALPTGMVIGALGYTSTLSISSVLSAFGIAAASSIFPPLAIALAVVVTVTIACFVLKAFYNFLTTHKGSLLSFIGEPFKKATSVIDNEIDPTERPYVNLFAKVFTYTLTGIVCTAATAGLAVAAVFSGTNSLAALAKNVFHTSATVSAVIGITLGGGISFISRFFQTIASCAGSCVSVLKMAIADKPENKQKIDKFGVFSTIFDVLATSVFYFASIVRPEAVIAFIPVPNTSWFAAVCAFFTTARDLGNSLLDMFMDDHTVKSSAEKARDDRLARAVNAAKGTRADETRVPIEQEITQEEPLLVGEETPANVASQIQVKEKITKGELLSKEKITKGELLSKFSLLNNPKPNVPNDKVINMDIRKKYRC